MVLSVGQSYGWGQPRSIPRRCEGIWERKVRQPCRGLSHHQDPPPTPRQARLCTVGHSPVLGKVGGAEGKGTGQRGTGGWYGWWRWCVSRVCRKVRCRWVGPAVLRASSSRQDAVGSLHQVHDGGVVEVLHLRQASRVARALSASLTCLCSCPVSHLGPPPHTCWPSTVPPPSPPGTPRVQGGRAPTVCGDALPLVFLLLLLPG